MDNGTVQNPPLHLPTCLMFPPPPPTVTPLGNITTPPYSSAPRISGFNLNSSASLSASSALGLCRLALFIKIWHLASPRLPLTAKYWTWPIFTLLVTPSLYPQYPPSSELEIVFGSLRSLSLPLRGLYRWASFQSTLPPPQTYPLTPLSQIQSCINNHQRTRSLPRPFPPRPGPSLSPSPDRKFPRRALRRSSLDLAVTLSLSLTSITTPFVIVYYYLQYNHLRNWSLSLSLSDDHSASA